MSGQCRKDIQTKESRLTRIHIHSRRRQKGGRRSHQYENSKCGKGSGKKEHSKE